MLCEFYSTEYLISHEDELDWEEISSNKSIVLSNTDIKIFGKKINWKTYLINHQNFITTEVLEIASKYFNNDTYTLLSSFGIATEEFILNHSDKFDFELIIENCSMSEDGLLQSQSYWVDIPNIKKVFKKAKKVDIQKCPTLSLLLETL